MAKFEGPFMPLAEFRDLGFLHEINRLLLHPCGFALALDVEAGTACVWMTDDPEGWELGDDLLSEQKAERVADAWLKLASARTELFGEVVQRPPGAGRALTTTPLRGLG